MVAGSGMAGRGAIISTVVPANAGTHRHRICVSHDGADLRLTQPAAGVMGPGIRRDDMGVYPACFAQYLSRRWRFTSLPVGVRGSSASKSMLFGHLIGDRC